MKKSISIWRAWWAFFHAHPHLYLGGLATHTLVFVAVAHATGLIQRNFFDALTGQAAFGWQPTSWAIALFLIYLINSGPNLYNQYLHILWGFVNATILQANLFQHLITQPGAQHLPASTGEAVSRFRGDPDYVAGFTRWTLHIIALILFAIIAFIIMIRINLQVTLLVFIPLTIIMLASRLTMARFERYRRDSRSATGNVTGFIGELFGAVQAIKAATSEEQMLARLRILNDERQRTALKERLFFSAVMSLHHNTKAVGTGGILLVAAGAMMEGTFTVGDFSLFVFYLGIIMELIASIGMATAQIKQVDVSLQRMSDLLHHVPPTDLVRPVKTHLRGELPQVSPTIPPTQYPLQTLTVRNLTYRYPASEDSPEKGIANINFTLSRGSLTVITGRIGSGKSTLLRVLLGLLPRQSGEIFWNGQPIADPATFMVPPQVAYTPQLPMLFSESVRENILLGLDEKTVGLPAALRSAILEPDIAQLAQGLETVVGPRGVKLSGGQQQRTAAARMFVRPAELLIFDDLSSALDVHTEQALWDQLLGQHTTCLAVSNRQAVLQRADHVILLKDGRVEDMGTLDEVLRPSGEMESIWRYIC